ncbi:glucosaminidase domain-containing protein [Chitinophaga sp. Cy-1792]|uniref:glucosaminidase domain-containing protein n=1 Tax=Chitinophaga sp. Cy-1792 TaxID=2608339 RepID=UPI001423F9EE|nr:glucosaminidase domain-containing protein [Chitinophaga sp. Cy-1792]NIG53278.1 LysM peptidoglycan-binding domain-containing protein [Chitinophaga sp. Cy-1792]
MQVRKFLLVVSFLIGATVQLHAQKITTQQYIETYKQLAIDEQRRTGVPAAITLAQGVVETQSGNGALCQQSNNHFGIKCKNTWTGKTIKYDDDAAQECFRVYETARESYKDHSDFLRSNPRYAFLFQFDGEDYKSWAFGLKQAGYATNKTYPQQLIKVIEDNNLQRFSLIALGKLSPEASEASSIGEGMANNGTVVNPKPRPVTGGSSNKHNQSSKPVAGNYPKGIFEINGRKAVFAKAGTSLIQLADQRDMRLSKLVRFNDLPSDAPLKKDMIIFLQKKAKKGGSEFHTVAKGESLLDVAQAEGIQLKWLRRRNKLHEGDQPAAGQKLALTGFSSNMPALAKNSREEEEDEEEEIAYQPPVKTPAKTPASQQNNSQTGGIPVAMIEDLKKNGDVTVSNGNSSAPATTPAVTPAQPPAKATMPAPSPSKPATPAPVASTPAPAPVKTTGGSTQYHDVQPKETLYGIARMYNKSVTQLQEWNNLQGFDIKIGQRLLVGK